jgi:hypothetical protein
MIIGPSNVKLQLIIAVMVKNFSSPHLMFEKITYIYTTYAIGRIV